MASHGRSVAFVPADGRLRLEQLRSVADEFDGLSQEMGETYPAYAHCRLGCEGR